MSSPQNFRIWFRYFNYPDDLADHVDVSEGDTIPELCRTIAECRLVDPIDPERYLSYREINTWQVSQPHKNLTVHIYINPFSSINKLRSASRMMLSGKRP